jgi:hypothetical protein
VKASDVPGGLTWKRGDGPPAINVAVEYSVMGKTYKRVTDRSTGEAIYYRLLVEEKPMTPAEVIDAEPIKSAQKTQYRLGTKCWFIDSDGRWYLCVVAGRTPRPGSRVTIRPVTGLDAEREKPWPYGGELEFAATGLSQLFKRLRPLRARQP